MVDGEGRGPPEKKPSGATGWSSDVLLPVDVTDPAVAAARRRRRRRVLGAAAVAAAAVVLWSIVGRRAGGPEPTLAVKLDRGGAAVRPASGGDAQAAAAVGDRVVLEVSGTGKRHVEVRVFREGGSMLLRCPGSLRCRRVDGRLIGELLLTAPGRYQAIMAVADRPLPAPEGTFAADGDRLRAARARVVVSQPIAVSAGPPAE
jgi:hypothetical protein